MALTGAYGRSSMSYGQLFTPNIAIWVFVPQIIVLILTCSEYPRDLPFTF